MCTQTVTTHRRLNLGLLEEHVGGKGEGGGLSVIGSRDNWNLYCVMRCFNYPITIIKICGKPSITKWVHPLKACTYKADIMLGDFNGWLISVSQFQ